MHLKDAVIKWREAVIRMDAAWSTVENSSVSDELTEQWRAAVDDEFKAKNEVIKWLCVYFNLTRAEAQKLMLKKNATKLDRLLKKI